MLATLAVAALTLTCESGEGVEYSAVDKLIARIEATPWPTKSKIDRVRRDDLGNITGLRLMNMQMFSRADFETLAKIKTLEYLSLSATNVVDADLKLFQSLPKLRALSLTNTKITDDAIAELMAFPKLESLCLGNVKVTPAAVDRMKAHYAELDRKFRVGYRQRK